MDAPAAKRVSTREHSDAIDTILLESYDLPLDIWSVLTEQGGLEVADLISLQRSCKGLKTKLSDNTSSASLMWHSAVQHSPYVSQPRIVLRTARADDIRPTLVSVLFLQSILQHK
jgi:hypothetical protein